MFFRSIGGDGVDVIGIASLVLVPKKCSVNNGAIAWGLTVFMGLFVPDTAVVIRYLGNHTALLRV